MSNHIIGLWRSVGTSVVDVVSDVEIAKCTKYYSKRLENARLIAAAPDLLNALSRVLPFVDCCSVITPEDFREYEAALADAEAAIAKATGGEK
jgi:hypothetical protein